MESEEGGIKLVSADDMSTVEAKHKVWLRLRNTDLRPYKLEDVDRRLLQYIEGIQQNEELHNLYEILGALKFLRMMRQYTFRASKVKRFCQLYESLKFSGMDGRRSYKLTPIQYYQFTNILGFYDWVKVAEAPGREDTEKKAEEGKELKKGEGKRWKYEGGYKWELRRLVKRVILYEPRKFSKTTSTASLAVNEFLFGDSNSQTYTAANSYKQAQVAFKEIRKIIKQLDRRGKYFKTLRETLTWKEGNRLDKESLIECLSGGADTKDGLNAAVVIFDEYGAAKYVKGHSDAAELLMVLESSMGARREPLVVIITTAGRVPDGPFALELDNAKRVLLGEWEDDSLFSCLLMPDAFDDDYGSPLLWRKVNPHIGVTVQMSYYEQQWGKAQHDAEQMKEFTTKLLNVMQGASIKAWIPRQLAMKLQREFDIKECVNRPKCMVGIDLSVCDDFSVVVYNIRDSSTKNYYLWLDCYIPEAALENHPNRLLYEVWVKAGWMKVCPGDVIDHTMIVGDILANNKVVKILQIGYDPAKAKLFVNAMSAAIQGQSGNPDEVMVAVPQSYQSFTAATEVLEYAAKVQPAKLALSKSPIWPYCFGNAYLDVLKSGLKKPIKEKENLKIDPVIGAIETFWLYGNYKRGING